VAGDEEEDVSSYWVTLRKKGMQEIERGNTRSRCV